MDCLFCAVAAGEVDVDTVFADDDVVAFLDHRPLFPGHAMPLLECASSSG